MKTRIQLSLAATVAALCGISAVSAAEGRYRVLDASDMAKRFARYAAGDDEIYTNAYSNAEAFDALRDVVPRFACPDERITDTYYFRWWTYRKHLKLTPSGWVVTEFLPDVRWAGKNNTIACPLGHQIREGRWLSEEAYLDDYLRFMLTEGCVSGPRTYVNWPAWSALERAKVTGKTQFLVSLLPKLVANYETWEKGWVWRSTTSEAGLTNGLFRSICNREGTEIALSADGARPMVNSAMWAEATAIAKIARLAGDSATAETFARRADGLERAIKSRLWHPERAFFTTEATDGRHDSVCELHGYAPFYFGMPLGADYAEAWRPLTDEKGFLASKGLVFPRRDTPGFVVSHDCRQHECQWNGPSWPYATSVALTALYETLQSGQVLPLAEGTFATLLGQYAGQHRLALPDGREVPWIDENLDPFTGAWLARDLMLEADRTGFRKLRYRERGKDYNHSTFCDLVISGLCGLVPRDDDEIVVRPLAPKSWDWWCLDGVRYRGKNVTILYDRDGTRYGRGKGLVILSETGTEGGAEVARFSPYHKAEDCTREVVPAPGVTDNVTGELSVVNDRDNMSNPGKWGARCLVRETPGAKVLARYAKDGLPAVVQRDDADCRRVYVCEPGGLTPGLLNRLVREAGGYAATDGSGLQVNMNGDFVSVHCLRPGTYDFRLPFACEVRNLKSGALEPVRDGCLKLTLTAGETCRFALSRN